MSSRGAISTFGEFARNGLGIPLVVMVILAMMVLPLPAFLLDVFFTFNISLSLTILLAVIYVRRAIEFAAFPTVLLGATLLRLGLNVASTRVVLMNGHTGAHAAGHVIAAFGQFVVGGNYAVGMVVFVVLVIINFVVITKGAGRISEVSARFTLDAMPGRQMAIDADLNAGIITQAEAINRRQEVREEADFYGAMDGASKFVRGDAIAGILVVFINLFGGIVIGAAQHGMPIADAGRNYALLTIGDGLVAQIPALLLSVAVAILVTRVSRPHDVGQQIMSQVLGQPRALAVTGGILTLLGIIPGMPNLVFLVMAGACAIGAYLMSKKRAAAIAAGGAAALTAPAAAPAIPAEQRELSWDDVEPVDLIGLEVGLPADSPCRSQSGRRTHGPHQGRAQETVRGARFPGAGGAHPRQPGIGPQLLPHHHLGRAGRRIRGVPRPRTRHQPRPGFGESGGHTHQGSGVRPRRRLDREDAPRPGAIAGLHGGRCQQRHRHTPEPPAAGPRPRTVGARGGAAAAHPPVQERAQAHRGSGAEASAYERGGEGAAVPVARACPD
jgi:hypothetical protein